LSYPTFSHSGLKTEAASDGGPDVGFEVKNNGSVASDEVHQVYIGTPALPSAGADFAVHALAAFDCIHLEAGQSQTVTVHVPLRSLQYWSTVEGKWVKAAGSRSVRVGGSSSDLPLQATVSVHSSRSGESLTNADWFSGWQVVLHGLRLPSASQT